MNSLAVLDRISPPRIEGSVRGQTKPRAIPVPMGHVRLEELPPLRETLKQEAELYFPYTFQAASGLSSGQEVLQAQYLGFRAQTLVIDNPTGYTLFVPQANRYVGPNTFARVLALYPSIDTLRILCVGGAVGSTTQISLVATQRRQSESPGYSTISPGTPVVSGAVEILDGAGVNKLAVDASGKVGINNFPAVQPISSTDGAQATLGTTTDASTQFTLVGLLKAVKAAVQGTLTVAFGSAQPVTLPAGQAVELLDSGGANKGAINASGQLAIQNFPAAQSVMFPSAQPVTLPAGQAVELLDSGGTNKAAISAAGAVKVDGSAVTQPVSGTVSVSGTPTINVTQWNGTTVDTNSGLKSAGTLRVVLATDQPQLTNKLLVTPDSVALPAHQSTNVDEWNGTTVDTNSGLKSAGTLRVVLATDQPQLTNKLLVTPDSVALPAHQSTNVDEWNGTTVDTNSGLKSAGTLRVVLATDQPTLTNAQPVTLPAGQAVEILDAGGTNKLGVNAANQASVHEFGTPAGNSPTAQQTSTASAATLLAARATRKFADIFNTDTANAVWVGPATVTTANGIKIPAGQSRRYYGQGLLQIIDNGSHALVDTIDYFD